jgi:L-asparagine transporter-like permease
MAGVFVISTCTIGLRTAIIPRWIAIIGYACALVLMLVMANWKWITFVFPLWMLLLSIYIFIRRVSFSIRLAPKRAL